MSQYSFNTFFQNEKTNILMGWDKPMQGFFLVIQKASDEDCPFWSNLDADIECTFPKDINLFLSILKNAGIEIPQKMIEEFKKDKENNTGNRKVSYFMDEK